MEPPVSPPGQTSSQPDAAQPEPALDPSPPPGEARAPLAPEGRANSPAVPSRYAPLWAPLDETAAKIQIFTNDREEDWRLGTEQDHARVRPHYDSGSTVLDLGCGIGRLAAVVAPRCRALWAVDVSPQMLTLAAKRLAACRNIRYVLCQDTAFPDVPDQSIDLAYCLLVMQHLELEDSFLLLEELRRVTRPSGTIVVTYPNLLSDFYLDCFVAYAHRGAATEMARARIYTPQEVDRLMTAAGFRAEITAETEIRVVARPI